MPFLRRKADPGAAFEPKFEALESVLDAVARLVDTEPKKKKTAAPTKTNRPFVT